ncbi:MAG: PadR family transcriptional regulator [Nitrososphaerota archaeon]
MLETVDVEKSRLLTHLQRRTVKNFMDILVLAELRKRPMSGYDVITSIYRRFNFLPSSGSIYSLLYSLERKELVKGAWSERKRIYVLTLKGEEILEASKVMYGKIERLVTKIFSDGLL